jgi:predicted NAD-dependent protein-ADP-ribosyltransferase YbiA (DUF1768 family)
MQSASPIATQRAEAFRAALSPIISSIACYHASVRATAREAILDAISAHIAPPNTKVPLQPFPTRNVPVASNGDVAKILFAAGFDAHGSVMVHVPGTQRIQRSRVVGKLVRVLHAIDVIDAPQPLTFLKPTAIDTGFLSPWFRSQFFGNSRLDGSTMKYVNTEQWTQAERARLFHDKETLEEIMNNPDGRLARDLGRQIQNQNEGVWQKEAFLTIFDGNVQKFLACEDILLRLLSSGLSDLINGDGSDPFLGGVGGNNVLGQATSAARLWLVNEFCRPGYFDASCPPPSTEFNPTAHIENPINAEEYGCLMKEIRQLCQDTRIASHPFASAQRPMKMLVNAPEFVPQLETNNNNPQVGQTLEEIAAEYGIPFAALIAANPTVPSKGALPIGAKLLIPQKSQSVSPPVPKVTLPVTSPMSEEGLPRGLLDDDDPPPVPPPPPPQSPQMVLGGNADPSQSALAQALAAAKKNFVPPQIPPQMRMQPPAQQIPIMQPQYVMAQQPMMMQPQMMPQQGGYVQQPMVMQTPQQQLMFVPESGAYVPQPYMAPQYMLGPQGQIVMANVQQPMYEMPYFPQPQVMYQAGGMPQAVRYAPDIQRPQMGTRYSPEVQKRVDAVRYGQPDQAPTNPPQSPIVLTPTVHPDFGVNIPVLHHIGGSGIRNTATPLSNFPSTSKNTTTVSFPAPFVPAAIQLEDD